MSIRKHTIYNLMGSLAPIVVTLFTVPVYLQLIGTERYGVLVIVWAFLGYFGMFDMGLSRATAQRIAILQNAEPKERSDVFWTATFLNLFFGIFAGLLLWPLAHFFFTTYFKVAENLRGEILAAVPWMASAVPVTTMSGVLSGALQGREKFLALNVSSLLGSVLFQIFPLIVAWLHGPDLSSLVLAALFGRISTFFVFFLYCYHYVPLKIKPSVRLSLIASLFRYGSWVTVTGFIGPILTTLDRFLIGSITGAKALSYYAVPFNLASRVVVLPSSLSNTLFPRFSTTSEDERNRLMDEAVRSLIVILTPLIIIGILIMEPFLKFWVGPDFANNASTVGEIIAIGLWFNGQAYIPYARLQAQGRPDLVAKCHLIEIIPYLAFLSAALIFWGVIGAAVAWSLRVIIDAGLLFLICGYGRRWISVHILPIFLIVIVAVAVFTFPPASMFRWAIGSSAFIYSLVWAWETAPQSVKRIFREGYQFLISIRKA